MRALLHECDPASGSWCSNSSPSCSSTPRRPPQPGAQLGRAGPQHGRRGRGDPRRPGLGDQAAQPRPHRGGRGPRPRGMDMLEAASQGIAGAMCTLHSKDSLPRVPPHPATTPAQGRANLTARRRARHRVAGASTWSCYLDRHARGTPGGRRDHPRPTASTRTTNRVVTEPVVRPRARPGRGRATRIAPIPAELLERAGRLRLRPGPAPRRGAVVIPSPALAGAAVVVGIAAVVSRACARPRGARRRGRARAPAGPMRWCARRPRSAGRLFAGLVGAGGDPVAGGRRRRRRRRLRAVGPRRGRLTARRDRAHRGDRHVGRDAARRHRHARGIEGILVATAVGHARR